MSTIVDRSHGKRERAVMPSDVPDYVGWFDRFATWTSNLVARATFFSFCVLLVIIWVPTIFLLQSIDTWQLIINTVTTIITFLMVALLQNTQTRSDEALQHKLNAIADALADLMSHTAGDDERNLREDLIELRRAVGLEQHETSSNP